MRDASATGERGLIVRVLRGSVHRPIPPWLWRFAGWRRYYAFIPAAAAVIHPLERNRRHIHSILTPSMRTHLHCLYLVFGLSLLGSGTAKAAAQIPTFPTLDEDAAVGDGKVALCVPNVADVPQASYSPDAPDLSDIAFTARCGVFRVDEDGQPGGRAIDLHFLIVPASEPDSASLDPVLFFPGGPGAGTVPGRLDRGVPLRALRRTRDLLLVDLRGTGRSNGLTCDVPYPGEVASRFGTIFPLDHIESCVEALSHRADLQHYTTAATVDDLEALRRWLGYPSVNLYGGSYGTRVAQVYMRRYPEAVRTAVLNGVTPVSEPTYVQTARGLQEALNLLVAECEAQAACRSAYPEFRVSLRALLDRLAEGPVDVEVDGQTLPFSAGDLSYALRGLLYGRAADIPYLVDRGARGELEELASYYLERTDWVSGSDIGAGNHFSVLCAEDIEPVTEEDVERATAGTFMGDHVIRGYLDACAVWPNTRLPASYFRPVVSDTPTLLLSGGRDPVTPPSGANAVAAHLSHSLHVVVPNAGHGVGGPCVTAMMVRLIEDGSLERVDASCIDAAAPTLFRTPTG